MYMKKQFQSEMEVACFSSDHHLLIATSKTHLVTFIWTYTAVIFTVIHIIIILHVFLFVFRLLFTQTFKPFSVSCFYHNHQYSHIQLAAHHLAYLIHTYDPDDLIFDAASPQIN